MDTASSAASAAATTAAAEAAAAAAAQKPAAAADAGVHVLPVSLAALVASASANEKSDDHSAPSAAAAGRGGSAASAEVERRLGDTERSVVELRQNLDAFVSRVQRDVADIALATRQSVLSMAREIAHMLALLDSSLSSIPPPNAVPTVTGTGSLTTPPRSPTAAASGAAGVRANRVLLQSTSAADLDQKYETTAATGTEAVAGGSDKARSASPPANRRPQSASVAAPNASSSVAADGKNGRICPSAVLELNPNVLWCVRPQFRYCISLQVLSGLALALALVLPLPPT